MCPILSYDASRFLYLKKKKKKEEALVKRHHVYATRKPREVPAGGPTAGGSCLGSVGGIEFSPRLRALELILQRDCNRPCSTTDTEGRGSFTRNESRSRERSAFNRIKHVTFLRPPVILRGDKTSSSSSSSRARHRRSPRIPNAIW
jgi:hypothetical protein